MTKAHEVMIHSFQAIVYSKVSQLNKCVKSIWKDKNDCILYKITL